ncbi:fimbrial protein [Aeromonas hydrophila]|nr:fimbrial protein [Aeromonas hydrophila]
MIRYFCMMLCFSLFSMVFSYSTALHANVLDGGEIRFRGLVTDDAPKWTWQLGATGTSWNVDIADAQVKSGTLVFDLRNRGVLAFLEGHLHEVADRGGPGFTPSITFSSGGQLLSVTDGSHLRAQHYRAAVPVRDPESGSEVGRLFFTLDQGMVVSVGLQKEVALPAGMLLVSGQSVDTVKPGLLPQGVMSRLSALLVMNSGFGRGMSASNSGQVISQDVLSDSRVTDLAAAYASALSEFELHLPAEGTPARWQAGLTVTVTVQ